MNKAILIGLAVVVLVVVGYFLLADDTVIDDAATNQEQSQNTTQPNTNGNDDDTLTDDDSDNTDNVSEGPNQIVLADNDTGSSAVVASMTIVEDAFVAFYRTDSVTGNVEYIGASDLLEAGTYTELTVGLDASIMSEDSISAVLFSDDGDGVFSIEDGDVFLSNPDRNIVSDIDVVDVDRESEPNDLLEQAEEILVDELEEQDE